MSGSTHDWRNLITEDFYNRLVLYAHRLCKSLTWNEPQPDPRDLVNEAILRVADGRRTCPPDVDFFYCLTQIIRSLASNAVTSMSNLPAIDIDEEDIVSEEDLDSRDVDKLVREAELDRFIDSLPQDDELPLQRIALLIAKYQMRPAKVAKALGLRVEKVYAAIKRIKQLAKDFHDEE